MEQEAEEDEAVPVPRPLLLPAPRQLHVLPLLHLLPPPVLPPGRQELRVLQQGRALSQVGALSLPEEGRAVCQGSRGGR